VRAVKPISISRCSIRALLTAAVMLAVVTDPDPATAQWEKLVRSERYEVSLDTDSVRSTTSGRRAVWLKFIPLGESLRRQAAAEYGKKEYRQHLEYYEIDCGDNSAIMGRTEIIGPAGKRLERRTGGGSPDAIIPGSVLDSTAKRICPVLEENIGHEDDAPDKDATIDHRDDSSESLISAEAQQRITGALRRTETEPAGHAAWVELGNAYYDADRPWQAIEAYNRALALKPDDADVLNDQGAMFRQTGDIPQALRNFEKALVIDPSNLESLYNTGYIYAFDVRNLDRAREIWQQYLKLDRSSDTARQVQSFIDRYGR
jgi:tetratricopeptide (TPR) repeat protein